MIQIYLKIMQSVYRSSEEKHMALKPVRVSQLNSYIKRILQSDPILGNISVIGEISNLKFHSSGHRYFSMKYDNCAMYIFH